MTGGGTQLHTYLLSLRIVATYGKNVFFSIYIFLTIELILNIKKVKICTFIKRIENFT